MKRAELLDAFTKVKVGNSEIIEKNSKISEKLADIFYLINNFDEEVSDQNLQELLVYIETAAEYDTNNLMSEFIKAIPSGYILFSIDNLKTLMDALEQEENFEVQHPQNEIQPKFKMSGVDDQIKQKEQQVFDKADLKKELLSVLANNKHKVGLKIDWLKYIILKDENKAINRRLQEYRSAAKAMLNKFKVYKEIDPIFMVNPNNDCEIKLNLDSTSAILNISRIKNKEYEYIRSYVIGAIEKLEFFYNYSTAIAHKYKYYPAKEIIDFYEINPENEAFFSKLTKVRKASSDIDQSEPKRYKIVEKYDSTDVEYETASEENEKSVVSEFSSVAQPAALYSIPAQLSEQPMDVQLPEEISKPQLFKLYTFFQSDIQQVPAQLSEQPMNAQLFTENNNPRPSN